jgi:hypothetical protein
MRWTTIGSWVAALWLTILAEPAGATVWKYAMPDHGGPPILTAHELVPQPQGPSVLVVTRLDADGTVRAAAGLWGRGGLNIHFAHVAEARDPFALLIAPGELLADPDGNFLPAPSCQVDATETFLCPASGALLPGNGRFSPARPPLPRGVPDLVSGTYRLHDAEGVAGALVWLDLVNVGERLGAAMLAVLVDPTNRYRALGGGTVLAGSGLAITDLRPAKSSRVVTRRPVLALSSPFDYFRHDEACRLTLSLADVPSFVCRDVAAAELSRGELRRLR